MLHFFGLYLYIYNCICCPHVKYIVSIDQYMNWNLYNEKHEGVGKRFEIFLFATVTMCLSHDYSLRGKSTFVGSNSKTHYTLYTNIERCRSIVFFMVIYQIWAPFVWILVDFFFLGKIIKKDGHSIQVVFFFPLSLSLYLSETLRGVW